MASHRDNRGYNMSSPPEGTLMDSFQGTPETRLTMFSPGDSTSGAPGYANDLAGPSTAAPARRGQNSIYNDRVVSHYESDPFVDSRDSNGNGLSPTAATFQPIGYRAKGKAGACFLPEGSPTVANALSDEMIISHTVEVCATPPVSVTDIGNFITERNKNGVKLFGGRNLETSGGRVYVVFEDLRDADWAFHALRQSPQGWIVVYINISQERIQKLDQGSARLTELGQVSVVTSTPNFSIIDPGHVLEITEKALNTYGQLFALVRQISYPDGSFRAVAQFCKATDALNAIKAFNSVTIDGVKITVHDLKDTRPSFGGDDIANSMQGMTLQAPGSRYQQPGMFSQDNFGMNPYMAGPPPFGSSVFSQAQFAQTMPFPGQFYQPPGPPSPAMTSRNGGMIHSRDPSLGYGALGGFGRLDPRRQQLSRYGRGPSRGMNNNVVDLSELIAGRDVRTTIMLRNIPNKVDQPLLKRIVDASSFGKYDFMYLRIDFANDCNVGYAFINFVRAEYIIDFVQERANKRWNCFKSDKVAEVSYATIQGKDCLVQKFRNSSVMLEAEHYRPKLFYTVHSEDPTLIGKEEPFPGPDNHSKMRRSCENAEHVGLFTPTAGQHFRDEQRRRTSQYDRGTRLAALEEISNESSLGPYYGRNMRR
ncbi:hypothetical protein FSARC_8145 [Fusarium sarcochroum]|uniref:RRM domain-containing protein n=1 Tax=Fusarium sarcochroum TaxID=1208366 RepID=A0A8H4TTR4_9HYPO|nr:hypothetical protein FSARC_8145 [Fusarium sarcochroum]